MEYEPRSLPGPADLGPRRSTVHMAGRQGGGCWWRCSSARGSPGSEPRVSEGRSSRPSTKPREIEEARRAVTILDDAGTVLRPTQAGLPGRGAERAPCMPPSERCGPGFTNELARMPRSDQAAARNVPSCENAPLPVGAQPVCNRAFDAMEQEREQQTRGDVRSRATPGRLTRGCSLPSARSRGGGLPPAGPRPRVRARPRKTLLRLPTVPPTLATGASARPLRAFRSGKRPRQL